MQKNIIKVAALMGLISIAACKKLVDIDPPATSLVSTNVYQSDASATSALNGIFYNLAVNNFISGSNSMSFYLGVAADELKDYVPTSSQPLLQFYINSLSNTGDYFWSQIYKEIYYTNAAIEGVNGSASLSDACRKELTGEAKFVRALMYFYNVNLHGDVPLTLSTDYLQNGLLSRTPVQDVYQQVIADLTDAENLLSDQYLGSDAKTVISDRTRPTKWAAIALLARVYLYTRQWSLAEQEAGKLIGNSSQFGLEDDLNNVFLNSSREAIWQIQPVQPGYNTYDGFYFILTAKPNGTRPVALNSFLLDAFEPGDLRSTAWVKSLTVSGDTYYYPYKYKIGVYNLNGPFDEYVMAFRLAEQYLIRAEARAQQNNLTGAADDLNAIRNRAGLGATPAATQADLLAAILHERQTELFTEWGHRWFDLIRTENIDAVMGGPSGVTAAKGGTWDSHDKLLPVPTGELEKNSNLVQNTGY